ncbi:hypothetical protein SAMN05421504_11755 [Amycolatopsis xylanica]|uniref:Uncharacterized protein n=1 Tax=Amycolatopsis xylanica TaxID=589385 RepID=A0A1H3T2S5_9PSEU|nr:hypothetical protein [Amycolatopsis xylanica]SDZ44673.1 hypothetical protein SAMN05421504_11755 [Amycolatopsis xylanica]
MNKNDLLKLAADKAQEKIKGGAMTGKAWIGLLAVGLLVLMGFLAYRLILIELITQLRD